MSAAVMPPEESEAKQKDETVQPEADEQDPDQDTGKSKPANGANQSTGQPSTTAQPPLRVSQRTQNAKKQGRNEASDCTYNKKSKVSLVGRSDFKFGASRPL